MGGCTYIYRYNSMPKHKVLSDFSLLLFVFQFLITPLINSALINEMMFVTTTMLVIAFATKESLIIKILNLSTIQFVGRLSFSIYLLHHMIIEYTDSFVFSILLTLFFSYFYHMFFEVKMYSKYKNKIHLRYRINIKSKVIT